MSSVVEKIYRGIVKDAIDPFFKANRFEKSGRKYYKQLGEIWHTFDIQILDKSDDHLLIVFNFGICHSSAFEFSYGYPMPEKPFCGTAMIRPRIGQIVNTLTKGTRTDFQGYAEQGYSVDDATDPIELKKRVSDDLQQCGLVFLNEFQTEEDIIQKYSMWESVFDSMYYFLYNKLRPIEDLQKLFQEQYNLRFFSERVVESKLQYIIAAAEKFGVEININPEESQ